MSAEEDAGGARGGVNSEDTPTTVVRELSETRGDLLGRNVFGEVGDHEDVGEERLLECKEIQNDRVTKFDKKSKISVIYRQVVPKW